jgi:hypothetical protein
MNEYGNRWDRGASAKSACYAAARAARQIGLQHDYIGQPSTHPGEELQRLGRRLHAEAFRFKELPVTCQKRFVVVANQDPNCLRGISPAIVPIWTEHQH